MNTSPRLTITSLVLAAMMFPGPSLRAVSRTVVDWRGDYVSSNQPFQRTGTVTMNGTTLPFSDTQELNPIRGAAYGGTSAAFYGGWRAESFVGGAPSFETTRVTEAGTADALTYTTSAITGGGGTVGQFFGLMVWTKPTFLNGGDSLPVTLDANSNVTFRKAPWNSGVDGKIILRDGSTFYVSDTNLGGGTGTNIVGLNRTWATYDPFTNLQFTGGAFAPHTFTDISAAGLYFSGTIDGGTPQSFTTEQFTANLATVPEPVCAIWLGIFAMGATLSRSRQ